MSKRTNSSNATPAAAPFLVILPSGKQVSVKEEAIRLGYDKLPASDATEPTEVETAILRQGDQANVEKAETTNGRLEECDAAFGKTEEQLPTESDLENTVHESRERIEHDLAADTRLARLREDERTALRSLRVFMRRNDLTREAHFPDSQLLHNGLLAILVLIECVTNTHFLALGSPMGLAGGLLIAVLLVAFNLGTGLYMGSMVVPYLKHVVARRRLWAGVKIALYIVLLIGVNLIVAHYRDLWSVSATPAQDMVGALLRGPLDLTFHSFLLFLVGVLTALMAMWKAYEGDDHYPEYGKYARRHRDARNAYEQAKTEVLGGVLASARGVAGACDALIGKADGQLERMQDQITEAQKELESYDARRQYLTHEREVLLKQFRDENQNIRRETPVPAYFADFPPVPDLANRAVVASMIDRLRFAKRLVAGLKAAAARIKAEGPNRVSEVATRFDEFLDARLRHVEGKIQSERRFGEDDEPPAVEVRA